MKNLDLCSLDTKINGNDQYKVLSYKQKGKKMNLSKVVTLGVYIGAIVLFSGCGVKALKCTAPNNSSITIEAIGTSSGPVIIKDRMNLFGEATYNNNMNFNGNIVTADKSLAGMFLTTSGLVASNSIKLNGDNDTVENGQDVYKCEDKLITLVDYLKNYKNEAKH